jgi:hypothetical protein
MGPAAPEGSTIGVEASESHCESKTAQGASLVMTAEGFRRPMRPVSQIGLTSSRSKKDWFRFQTCPKTSRGM